MSNYINNEALNSVCEDFSKYLNSEEGKQLIELLVEITSLIEEYKNTPGYFGAINLIHWCLDKNKIELKNITLPEKILIVVNQCKPFVNQFGCQHIFNHLSNLASVN